MLESTAAPSVVTKSTITLLGEYSGTPEITEVVYDLATNSVTAILAPSDCYDEKYRMTVGDEVCYGYLSEEYSQSLTTLSIKNIVYNSDGTAEITVRNPYFKEKTVTVKQVDSEGNEVSFGELTIPAESTAKCVINASYNEAFSWIII